MAFYFMKKLKRAKKINFYEIFFLRKNGKKGIIIIEQADNTFK